MRGAGLLRIGREAARGREKGAAARKVKNLFLAHYQHTTQRTLQNFAFSRSAKNKCRTFALSIDRQQTTVDSRQTPSGGCTS